MSNPAYETGNCSSLDDFFTKLWTFCTSTIDASYQFTTESVTTPQTLNTSGDPSGGTTYSYTVKCLSRGSYYWWVRYHSTGGVYGMVAPNGGSASWNSISGKPTYDCQIFPIPGAGTYYFFAYNYFVHAVCVLSSGVCVHINFGTGDKVGSWTGGEIFTGAYSNVSLATYINNNPTSVRHRYLFHQGNTNRSISSQLNAMMRCVYNGKNFAMLDYTFNTPPSGYNLVLNLGGINSSYAGSLKSLDPSFAPNSYSPYRAFGFDIELQLLRDADDGLFYDLCTIPGARFVNMQYLNTADVINSDWLVFPLCYKGTIGSVGNYAATGDYGIAYYKGP